MKNVERTLIFVAMKEEAQPIIDYYELESTANENEFVNEHIHLCITGIGVTNVIKFLGDTKWRDYQIFDKIVNLGYVGSDSFKFGDIVEVMEYKRLTPPKKVKGLDTSYSFDYGYTTFPKVTLYTADDFVEGVKLSKNSVVDMEGFYLRSFFDNLISIKIVSDDLNEENFDNNIKQKKLKEAWAQVLYRF